MVTYTVGLSDSTRLVENQSDQSEDEDLDLLKKKLQDILEEMQDELGSDDDGG